MFAAITSKQMGHLESQKRLWERYGHTQLELLDQRRIREVVACDLYQGGMLDMSGGHIHPLNLALGEAAAVESLGGVIYEQSPAVRIERGANPVIHTPQGKVRAKFVIVAGNAYLGNLVPELAAKSMPCGTQVITTEPLGDELAKSLLPRTTVSRTATICWITTAFLPTSALSLAAAWCTALATRQISKPSSDRRCSRPSRNSRM